MDKKQIRQFDNPRRRSGSIDSLSRRQFIGVSMLASIPGSFAAPTVFAQEHGLREGLVMIDGWILCESDLEELDVDVY